MDLKALGIRIKQLRQNRSVNQLAARADISATYWGDIEKAKVGKTGEPIQPSANAIKAIAEALSPEDLELRAELLELAGHDEAAAIDRVRTQRIRRTLVSSAGGDLDRLRDSDPEAYERVMADVRFFLDRAEQRDG